MNIIHLKNLCTCGVVVAEPVVSQSDGGGFNPSFSCAHAEVSVSRYQCCGISA